MHCKRSPLPLWSRWTGVLAGSLVWVLVASAAQTVQAAESGATFAVRQLVPEVALKAARAALEQCRSMGAQVTVVVADRSGTPQVLLRDRFAGQHTLEAARQKAWTAASFRMSTAALAAQTEPGLPLNGLRALSQVLAVAGGQVVEADGSVLGSIGVSGAPGGDADERCAMAGLRAIADDIDFSP
jgi:uncharacterized protein GlcG (DUF336 family)